MSAELEWVPSAIVGDHDLAAKEKGPIDLDIVRTAVKVTTLGGIPEMVSRWRLEDRESSGKKAGPQPWLPPAAIATLSLILTLVNRPPQVSEMRDILLDRFTPQAWDLLNVPPPDGASRVAVYYRIRNSREIVKNLINPEPGSLYTIMTKEEVAEMQAARDEGDCGMRRQRGLDWANAILHGTAQLLPDHVFPEYGGSLAIDATKVEAPASRGTSERRQNASAEPEAGWYKRDGDHDGSSTSRAKTRHCRIKSELVWGREVTTAVSLGTKPTGAPEVPHIVMSMSLDVPGKRLAENALTVVDAVLKAGHRAGMLVTDRAYMPHCKAEDLQLPLRRRGYRLVMDYDNSEHMLGVQAGRDGAILVEGTWYCPSMPDGLQTATLDYMMREKDDPLRITSDEYKRRVAQRVNYRLRRKELPDDGYTRRMCPAAGPSATAVCPLQEQHPAARKKTGLTLIRSANLLDPAPKVCTNQSTLTFSPTLGAKYEQEFAYKGEEWQAHYTYGRQTVESVNDSLKDGDSTIDSTTHRPARGWASQLMALAPMIAATNVRKIIDWLETGPREPAKRRRRRDTHGEDLAA